MKTYGGVEVQSHASLISALDGGKWLDPRTGHFNPGETARCIYSIGGWMGPKVGLDAVAKREKIHASVRNRTPVVQSLVTILTEPSRPPLSGE
jgi:hypothetical protein